MTLRRAALALSLVAVAAPAAASPNQSAPPPPVSQAPAAPAQPPAPAPAPTPAPTAPASPAAPPVDPAAIAFDVSVDHDAEDAAGPKLVKYVIDFVPAPGAPGTSYSIDLGKPKAVEGAVISVPLMKLLLPGTYVAHVRAIGRQLRTTTVTVGPFVITEKSAKTKAEFDKELRERQEAQERQEKQNNKKVKPPQAPPVSQPDTDSRKDGKDSKESPKPAGKGGFWKKFYEKIVG
jgi:hypothetical protein